VAIVMDGNGRWATARGLPRTAGHQAGCDAVERLVQFAGDRLRLEHLTLYAFSAENWKRPETEVNYLMDLLHQFIEEQIDRFIGAGVRLSVFGDVAGLPEKVRDTVEQAIERTPGNLRSTRSTNG
jgi:undecaprenyl diphosphate synthase